MAKTKADTDNVEGAKEVNKTFKAIARQHIKYGGKHIGIGEGFEVKECDLDELRKYVDIEEGD